MAGRQQSLEGLVDVGRLGRLGCLAMAAVGVGSCSTILVQNPLAVAGSAARTLVHSSGHQTGCSPKLALVDHAALAGLGLGSHGSVGGPWNPTPAGFVRRPALAANFLCLACLGLGSRRLDQAWNHGPVVVGVVHPAWCCHPFQCWSRLTCRSPVATLGSVGAGWLTPSSVAWRRQSLRQSRRQERLGQPVVGSCLPAG